jgi:protease IV
MRRAKSGQILLIEFTGVVNETNVESLLHELRDMALPSKFICAVVLRINSHGGSLGAAQSFAEGMRFLKAELKVPFICFVGEQALSAGFYVALSADEIIVTPSALLGSVGAVRHYFSIATLAGQLGIDVRTYSSGAHKAAMHPMRKISEEQELAVQVTLDETKNHFVEWIRHRRPLAHLDANLTDSLSSIMTGARCIDMKIADHLGGLYETLDRAGKLGSVTSPGILRVNFSQSAKSKTPLDRLLHFAFERLFAIK